MNVNYYELYRLFFDYNLKNIISFYTCNCVFHNKSGKTFLSEFEEEFLTKYYLK